MADVTADDIAADRPGGRPRQGPPYPAAWEADVVLHDGSTTHVRPMRPDDADALQAFHVGQSQRSTYLRFFAQMERLSERDLDRLVNVDHVDRVALVAVSASADQGADQIIGVARYDRSGPDEAEVAFNVADAHQGRGLGSVLLEHLAAAARERGVRRFVAEVLPQNGRMISVFKEAGYEVRQRTEDGVVAVAFDIDPTDRSLAVMSDREHRAEARSMRGLLHAGSVVVVGPGADSAETLAGRLASRVLEDIVASDPAAVVHAIGVAGAPSVPVRTRLSDITGPVDLAVVAVPATDTVDVVRHLARLGVHGIVLLTAGFAEQGPDGLDRQRAMLRAAHGAGMRIVGPASYGIISTRDDGLRLNASLARTPPVVGRIGLFCQSAPLAVALLGSVRRRGIGVSQFVSAGHRADVSGNDLMQFWTDDDRTDVVGLYLESLGNPRKFSRVARRLSSTKPVIVVTAGRSGQVVPPGHAVRPTHAPPRTLAEMLRQSGVVQVENTHQMLDVAQVLAHQPLPAGRRTAILASSASVAALVAEAAAAAGLVVSGHVQLLPEDAPADQVQAAVDALYGDPDSDVVVVVRIPTVGDPDVGLQEAVARAAARSRRTTVACIYDLHGITAELTGRDDDGREWTVPAYSTPEDAALALGHAARYAQWRAADRGRPLHPEGVDLRAARRLVTGWLAEASGDAVLGLDDERTAQLLATIGVPVLPSTRVRDADEAVAAAERIGWPVALKTTVPALRHRADLGGVRLDVADEAELRADVAQVLDLAAGFEGGGLDSPLEVQAMAEHGSACVVRSVEDPLFGPIISFGLAGDASDLLGDIAYGVPPLTDVDVSELVRNARAAPRLLGYRGLPALDVGALEDVIARVAVLADDLPELRSLELNPVVVSEHGAVVLGARASVSRADRADATRRLPRV
ncbi:bifunctional acetate--CoA ligase family protein/GNAT family N-acetyltransferase [Cellulomonas fengjieae]|uniref:GNAT family N-acetyltransferase n=1 Tax=Cellulomonas fengjieae TaxID=2819978 RepID=A0ABS3SEL0_9CELL|nr:GNAT family N-acetyltransferase [Cellulomonas fengjieae]MBO3084193.1 GNAT family N-acetyltransferase [Cellulomonas fengjieae]QVI64563.1 GNAT family N-acetyltransferase [Cellulomonas fengjieae]